MTLSLGSLGTFGGRAPQVLWLGVAGPGVPSLLALGASLARAPGLGPPEQRPFRPHLTLARVRRRRRVARAALERACQDVAIAPLSFQVREAVLFASIAGAGGPRRHEVLSRLPLGAAPAPPPGAPEPPAPSSARLELRRQLQAYLEGAAAKPPPSRQAHLALASAVRCALGHALPWPPAPDLVDELLRPRGGAAQARARRRLAERAPLEGRRVHQGLRDARRRLDEVREEAEEDPDAGAASAAREAEAWVARHGLPRAWFAEEAARLGIRLAEGPAPEPAPEPPGPLRPSEADVSDAPYRAALEAIWGEDTLYLGRRAEDDAGCDLELALARAPRPDELAALEELLSAALGTSVRVRGTRSLGGGRRRLRLRWDPEGLAEASAPSARAAPPAPPAPSALLERLSRQEPERHARREFLLGTSPSGDPVLLRQLLDRRGRADLACWVGPWEGRAQVALALGERALAQGLSAGVLLRATLRELGGAGGGSPRWAEGACPGEPEAVLRALRAWVEAGGLS